MYKLFKLILLFVVLAFAFAPEMKLKRVSGNIYMVRGVDALPSLENRGFMSNAFAVLTKEGWVVVDALSTPELSKEFVENLYRVKRAPIKYAIITHYHPDHWYGAKTYKELGAKIIAHHVLMEEYKSGQAQMALDGAKQRFKGLYDSVVLVPPDVVVKEDTELKVGEYTFKLIPLKHSAHTNNDLVVYMPRERVLFAGDLVSYKRVVFAGDRNASVRGWIKALRMLKGMDVEVILAGHNEPLKKDAMDDTLNYLTFLRERVKKMKEEGKSIDEIKQALAENPFKDYKMYNEFYNANIFAVYNQLDYEED
jgi:cyclase